MRKLILFCASLCTMVLLIAASPVQAQNVLWVANNGNNANACSQTAPCATFQGAISKGSVSQINCLTSGNYGGAFTITASITIDCGTGNVGNVVSSAGAAIEVNTGSGATIVLRLLSLNGLGTGAYGIDTGTFSSGTVIVEDCMVHGFNGGYGIRFSPNSGRGLLQVSNSQLFGNYGGFQISPTNSQIASVTLDHVEMVANSGFGLVLTSSGSGVVAGTMRNSIAGSNGSHGVYTDASQVYFTV